MFKIVSKFQHFAVFVDGCLYQEVLCVQTKKYTPNNVLQINPQL